MDDILKRLLNMLPPAEAAEVWPDLEERADLIRHKLKFTETRPAVVCISGIEPLKAADGWIADAVTLAGGNPLFSGAELAGERLIEANPGIIILALNGLSLEQSLPHLTFFLQMPGFMDLSAVKNKRFYLVDAAKYFTTPPASIIDAVEILAEVINPKQFIFGFEGEGWAKFSL